jgi:ubiquinone/menaquinone biosynthesis C-methylase UbiE
LTAQRTPDFDARARGYDELRPQNAAWWARFDALVTLGDLQGRRIVDIGCGTGQLAAALVERAHAKVWGVDPSAEMVAVARERVPRGVGVRQAHAESLPFRDAWFDRATMALVVHLLDRPSAFAEARRVVGPAGRLAIATFHPYHFDTYWLNEMFPRIAEIDRARFPGESELTAQLVAAGFAAVQCSRVSSTEELDRETALARVRGRHISTFDLLDPDEIRLGTERAETSLPERIVTRFEQLIVIAS